MLNLKPKQEIKLNKQTKLNRKLKLLNFQTKPKPKKKSPRRGAFVSRSPPPSPSMRAAPPGAARSVPRPWISPIFFPRRFIWRVLKMFVPDLVEIACSLARRFMFGLQNGDPKNVTFYKTFLENDKNPSVFASAKSFSLPFAGAGRTHLLYLFSKGIL